MEFQSTPNRGMILRAVMGEMAFRENFPELAAGKSMEHLLVLSGSEHPNFLKENHGKVVENRVRVIIIDLDQVEDHEFDMANPWDVVLRLAKSSVTREKEFVRAIDVVIGSNMIDDVAKDRLLMAAIVAAISKGGSLFENLREVYMGSNDVSKVLDKFAHDRFYATEADKLRQEGRQEGEIKRLKTVVVDMLSDGNRSSESEVVIDQMTLEQLESLWSIVRKASKSNDWTEVDDILSAHLAHKP